MQIRIACALNTSQSLNRNHELEPSAISPPSTPTYGFPKSLLERVQKAKAQTRRRQSQARRKIRERKCSRWKRGQHRRRRSQSKELSPASGGRGRGGKWTQSRGERRRRGGSWPCRSPRIHTQRGTQQYVNSPSSVVVLIVSSGNVDAPVTPSNVQEALSSDQSGPNPADTQEVNPVDPSPAPPAPSILHSAESGSAALSMLPQPLPVTVPSSTTDHPPDLECVREPAKSLIRALGPSAVSEDMSNRKPIASATANVILRGVGESSDVHPPLESVARHFCLILDNCEVRSPSHTFNL